MEYLLLFLGLGILAAFGSAFRRETGVDMPTRSALRSIRRQSNMPGRISEPSQASG